MKKLIVLTFFVMSFVSSTAMAQNSNVTVDSTPIYSDQLAYLEEASNITYVPLRAVMEELGGKVNWDEKRQAIIVERNGITAELKVNSDKAVVGRKEMRLEGPVKIDAASERSVVPVTFFSQGLRCRVEGNAATRIGIFDETRDSANTDGMIEEYNYKTDVIDISYPHFAGMNNTAAQERINKEFEEMAAKFIKNNSNEMTRSAVIRYKVHYFSKELVSITVIQYTYTGGAHGTSFRENYTYDLKTGVRYKFSDLFQFDTPAREDIDKQIASQIKERNIQTFSPFSGLKDNPYFYIADNGQPVIYFQQYDLGPYVLGILEFPVHAKSIKKT